MSNEGPQDPFQGKATEMAVTLHEMYTSLVSAGFSEEQAFAMANNSLQTLLTISMMGGGVGE